MFRRLNFDTWDGWIPLAGLLLTLAVFIIFFIRALRMKPSEVHHLSHLPLEDENDPERKPPTTPDHVH